jgi:hypothetical protein
MKEMKRETIKTLSVIIGFLSLISIVGAVELESDLTIRTNVTRLILMSAICLLVYFIITYPIAVKYTVISILSHILLYVICVYVFLGFGSGELDERLRKSYKNSLSWKSFWYKEKRNLEKRINRAYEKECNGQSR